MRRLTVFNQVSIDGYIADSKGDMSWAHKAREDAEWNAFTASNASGGGVLVFGRVTYDLMKSFWPTPKAAAAFPVVAERMNNLQKIVFSKTLDKPSWNNTTLIHDDIVAAVQTLKQQPGDDMVIFGSASIISQLAQHNLIDEYQIVVHPIILGHGKTMFEGVVDAVRMKLTSSRTFNNGNVLLNYEPAA